MFSSTGEEPNHLQDKKDKKEVSEQFIRRLAKADKQKMRLIGNEGSQKLMALLTKARSYELDDAEKEQLRMLLIEVLKVIPSL